MMRIFHPIRLLRQIDEFLKDMVRKMEENEGDIGLILNN
jgi:hypothetical protein